MGMEGGDGDVVDVEQASGLGSLTSSVDELMDVDGEGGECFGGGEGGGERGGGGEEGGCGGHLTHAGERSGDGVDVTMEGTMEGAMEGGDGGGDGVGVGG